MIFFDFCWYNGTTRQKKHLPLFGNENSTKGSIHPKHIIQESSGACFFRWATQFEKSRIYKYPPGNWPKKKTWETSGNSINIQPINEPPPPALWPSSGSTNGNWWRWQTSVHNIGNYHPKTIKCYSKSNLNWKNAFKQIMEPFLKVRLILVVAFLAIISLFTFVVICSKKF